VGASNRRGLCRWLGSADGYLEFGAENSDVSRGNVLKHLIENTLADRLADIIMTTQAQSATALFQHGTSSSGVECDNNDDNSSSNSSNNNSSTPDGLCDGNDERLQQGMECLLGHLCAYQSV
jgi:hypothetical protein